MNSQSNEQIDCKNEEKMISQSNKHIDCKNKLNIMHCESKNDIDIDCEISCELANESFPYK